jgi:hypothetical protein
MKEFRNTWGDLQGLDSDGIRLKEAWGVGYKDRAAVAKIKGANYAARKQQVQNVMKGADPKLLKAAARAEGTAAANRLTAQRAKLMNSTKHMEQWPFSEPTI